MPTYLDIAHWELDSRDAPAVRYVKEYLAKIHALQYVTRCSAWSNDPQRPERGMTIELRLEAPLTHMTSMILNNLVKRSKAFQWGTVTDIPAEDDLIYGWVEFRLAWHPELEKYDEFARKRK